MTGKSFICGIAAALLLPAGALASTAPAPVAIEPFAIDVPAEGQDTKPGAPPPVGLVHRMDETFVYKGAPIARDDAAKAGLACIEPAEGRTRCYDTPKQLAAAEHVATAQQTAVTARKRAKAHRHGHGKGHAANHYGSSDYPFWLYQHTGWQGWSVVTNSYCQWFNLDGFYGGNASSLSSGQHTAITATGYGGGGLTAGWQAWGSANNMHDSGWGDASYSRARVCL
jgi:hypothetical protein